MSEQFTCSMCGRTSTHRTYFYWLIALMSLLLRLRPEIYGWKPVCADCAPNWTSAIGRAFWALVGVGFLLVAWKWGVFR